ncbi:DUF2750 domain-containing protein [Alkalimarinus alittae]|uniref:DUF2750 domain-containing protein n=1 Tax=Alkalimarinus alittae TaxID=2961619 RepID=A0ABY6N289_9ALTE|nr:DUF2750 domain-containing protein [Alkalimarinus alittae]UZE96223.1 DUF2750 domain-containing protein [Alkalimarinus alittae]
MSDNELKSILELDCEERYDFFLSAVGEEKEVWILINSDKQFLKIYAEDDGFEYLPVWPNSEFATEYAKNAKELTPKSISLPEFFEKWVPGLMKDSIEIGVIPGLDSDIWVTPPTELQKDLQEELSNF